MSENSDLLFDPEINKQKRLFAEQTVLNRPDPAGYFLFHFHHSHALPSLIIAEGYFRIPDKSQYLVPVFIHALQQVRKQLDAASGRFLIRLKKCPFGFPVCHP